MMTSASNRAAVFLGLNRNMPVLLVIIVLIGTGEELSMRLVPKYLQVLGCALLVIGLFDGLKTLLGAVYANRGGIIVDRWGHRRALMSFTGVAIAGYLLLLSTAHWFAVIVGMFSSGMDESVPSGNIHAGRSQPACDQKRYNWRSISRTTAPDSDWSHFGGTAY
ncbi:MAG: hypothetical protein WKF37_18245 [Bryobacteraceae bacterium]